MVGRADGGKLLHALLQTILLAVSSATLPPLFEYRCFRRSPLSTAKSCGEIVEACPELGP